MPCIVICIFLILITYFCGFSFIQTTFGSILDRLLLKIRLKSLPPEVLAFQGEREESSRLDRPRYIAH